MPVQPQYSIGPLAQPAPPDGNQIPSHDGSARYVRSSPPPGLFLAESPESCQRSVGITSPNTVLGQMHRTQTNLAGLSVFSKLRGPEEYPYLDLGNTPQPARHEHQQLPTSLGFDVPLEASMPQQTPIPYSTLCAQNTANLHSPQSRNEFHVVKEDFPALPRIAGSEFPDESLREETLRRPSTTPQAAPETPVAAPRQDRYDLQSYLHQWSSKEFSEGYRLLNFEDVLRRTTPLHPTGECVNECVTRNSVLSDLLIGVILRYQCPQLQEPEDLWTEVVSYRIINGHKVPMPENDKYYAMPDELKDKLRNPRLQMMDDFTLFFQFYFFTRDSQQIVAADALFQRNWRWNNKISRWCRAEKTHQQGSVQAGVFQVYDPSTCRIQSSIFQYSPQDFEMLPPRIPPPTWNAQSMNHEEKL